MRAAILGWCRGWLRTPYLKDQFVQKSHCGHRNAGARIFWNAQLNKKIWSAAKQKLYKLLLKGQVTWHIYVCCVPQDFLRSPYLMKTVQCICYQPTRVLILRILYFSCFNMDNTFLIDLRLYHIKSVCNQIWAPIPKDLVIFNIWLFHLRSYTGNEWMA